MRHVRVGLFGIGLDAYWPQFAGLKERLEGYARSRGRTAAAARRRGRQPRPDRHAGEGARGGASVPPGGRRPHLPARHDLRAVVHGAAGRPAGARAGHRAQPPARGRDRLRGVQRDGRPHGDDRRMAGALRAPARCPRLPTSSAARGIDFHQVTGMLRRRSGVLGRGRRLDRRRARGRRDVAQPARPDGPLLRRHARHLLRPHPALRHVRRPHRDPGGGRAGGAPARGQRRTRCRHGWRDFRDVFDVQPDCAGRGARARGAHVASRSTGSSSRTTSARLPTTTWASASPRTRMRSARSSSATRCSPRAACRSPASTRSRTSRR